MKAQPKKRRKSPKVVSVRIVMYVEAKEKDEQARASTQELPSGQLVYPSTTRRVNVSHARIKKYAKQDLITDLEEFQTDMVNNPLDDHVFEDTINFRSYVLAYNVTIEGSADKPIKPIPADYLFTKPLQKDIQNKAINFQYITNPNWRTLGDPISMFKSKYIKSNFVPNSCLITLMADTFNMTYDQVWTHCLQTIPKGESYVASLQDVIPFFRHFRLKLVAVDEYEKIRALYDPRDDNRKLNHKISPCILRILVHQGHAYELNKNLDSFDQKIQKMQDQTKVQLSTRYNIREKFEFEDDVIIDNYQDIYKFITEYQGSASFVKIVCNSDMEDVIKQFRLLYKIIASNLSVKANKVSGFIVSQHDTVFKICNLKVRPEDTFFTIANVQCYRKFMSAYQMMYTALVNKRHKSTYHPQLRDALHYYIRGPLKGQLRKPRTKSHTMIDQVKAYTKRIMELKCVPLFDEFCFFRPYTYVSGTKLDDYSIYLVKSPKQVSNRNFLIFDKTYVLVTGLTLNETQLHSKCTILYKATPYALVPNKIASTIKKIWDSDLPQKDKKFIVNMSIGFTDKKYNKKTRSEFFDDKSEAHFHQEHGQPKANVLTFDTGANQRPEDTFYLLVDRHKVLMNEGFLPLSLFKYDSQRLSMWKLYGTLQQAGFVIVGMNTDCFYVEGGNIKRFQSEHPDLFSDKKDSDSIGKLRCEFNKECPENKLKVTENELRADKVEIESPSVTILDEEKTWDQKHSKFIQKCCALLKKCNMLIEGLYPGTGKSFIAKALVTSLKPYLMVVPFNKLCQALASENQNAITVHKLLGIGIDERHRSKSTDVSKIKVIIFDEIYLHSRANLYKIHKFMQAHQEIRFIATGDPFQNPAVQSNDYLHTIGDTWTQEFVMNLMFPKRLQLQVIKRVKFESDRIAYPKLKHDLFTAKLPVADIVAKHKKYFGSLFGDLSKITTKMNICHSNETRIRVNKQIHGDRPIEPGQKLILKGYIKGMVRNGVYTFTSVGTKVIKKRGKEFVVPMYDMKSADGNSDKSVSVNQFKLFELPHCWTSYAMQGLTHDGDMSVFDIHQPRYLTHSAHARSFWTAITRATSLKHVHIYTGKSNCLSKEEVHNIIARKINLHQLYDLDKSMYNAENFVTVKWVKRQLKLVGCRCAECGIQMTWTGNHQFSVDRIDNKLGHTTVNCRVICCSCNKAKH